MIYAIARGLAAALAFGLSAQIPWVAVGALVLLWSMSAVLVAPFDLSFSFLPLFFEVILGIWFGLAASLPIVAARMGAALGDARLAAPWETIGVASAGIILFAAGIDHLLLKAFAESFVNIPAGTAQSSLKQPEDLISLILLSLRFALKIGFPGLAALLISDVFNSLVARLFPGILSLSLPRDSMKALGLYASLGAIGYVILQAAQSAILLITAR